MTQDPPPFDGDQPYSRPAPVFGFNDAPTLPSGLPVRTETPEPPSASPSAGKLGRRALLAAGGLGLAAAGAAVAVPVAVQKTENAAKQQAEQAAAQAKQDLIAELQHLETEAGIIGLDAAIDAAGATLWATQHIFVPLSSLIATIGGDALGTLISLIGQASGFLGFLRVDTTPLQDLSATLQTWRTNLQQLPASLKQGATANVSGAELYLAALKQKLASEEHTPTPPPAQ